MCSSSKTGEEGFLAGLHQCQCDYDIRSGVIVFTVIPTGGAHANRPIETGVSVNELTAWPSVPPHWVHFPACIKFSHTNSEPSGYPTWLKHSRNITNWGNAEVPVQAWIAHVRSVLEASI